ncbi:rifin [Plasmodium falciparum IGH-CR14]|uniref:Rifin n=1 Tax=Plasmodium falciparum IGH-CR14 TaxID=580059 RepID=A0A0L1I4S7_PLAFA|nr:rifin [Plasmodium falciparum IGH-CR14]
MKVHYINILLFALPLNILVSYPKNPCTTLHTRINKSTKPHRLLCECQLYAPQNYDNDPEMKKVMENFGRKTSQRFEEYNERMIKNKQKCREQCDKEIQKIILKDKLEKELMDKFATLQTDIQNDAIPTCVCEKSLADKVEKGCLRCAGVLGGGMTPAWGLISGLGYVGWTNYVTQTALQKGIEAGVKYGIQELKGFPSLYRLINFSEIKNLINSSNYDIGMTYVNIIKQVKITNCVDEVAKSKERFCLSTYISSENALSQRAAGIADNAVGMAKITEASVLEEGASATSSLTTAIIASVIAIVVIILIMVIIYLILRYLRKKKMKKKLEYIKLLKE